MKNLIRSITEAMSGPGLMYGIVNGIEYDEDDFGDLVREAADSYVADTNWVDSYIDEEAGPFEILGKQYDASKILKLVDKEAYYDLTSKMLVDHADDMFDELKDGEEHDFGGIIFQLINN